MDTLGSDSRSSLAIFVPGSNELTGAPRRALTLAKLLKQHGIPTCAICRNKGAVASEARRLRLPTLVISTEKVMAARTKAPKWLWILIVLAFSPVRAAQIIYRVKRSGIKVVWVRASAGLALHGLWAWLGGAHIVWDIDYEPTPTRMMRALHLVGLTISSLIVTQYRDAPTEIFGPTAASRYSKKMETLVPGIDTDHLSTFQTNPLKRPPTDRFIIAHVGSITHRKGQLVTLEAAYLLLESNPSIDIHIWFLGGTHDASYLQKLRARAYDLGMERLCKFLGWQEDIYSYMATAQVLTLPSTNEGVPNAVQEAMYIGLPVVASPVGGTSDIITHMETGQLASPTDLSAWTRCLERVAARDPKVIQCTCKAKEFAQARFPADAWAQQYATMIETHCAIK